MVGFLEHGDVMGGKLRYRPGIATVDPVLKPCRDGITDVGDGGLRKIARKLVSEFLGGLNPAELRRPRPCQGADEILWRALAGLRRRARLYCASC